MGTQNVTHWRNVEFKASEVQINAMVQNNFTKEIQIVMGKDSVMKEHKAPFAISVQVLQGAIKFDIGSESYELGLLDMISLEANVAHSLHAHENSIVRLSLAKNDTIARVNAVLK